ncbi:cation:proton antiporter [Thalassotalea sp. M1531]|uniref:Cation:proton antiporter n=1 Tax=Thalassotalea algicola TaxID=2716224 RepID=A0A7Y0LBL2_9GAMM|nr:cation:proton antiporter [Thalassotalea algicola]NMP30070.1 cation:proton antiporter [Thalassotalea algicola]
MDTQTIFLISLGSLLLAGLTISLVGQRTLFPRVTLLIGFGILVGPEGIGLIPDIVTRQFDIIAQIALLMVGFLIGGKLTKSAIEESSKAIIAISIGASLLTTLIVTLGLLVIGVPIPLAIILGCIAAATDATAVFDVINQSTPLTKFKSMLLSVVALDDAWALILFGLGMSIVFAITGNNDNGVLLHAIKDVGGGLMLGILLGVPAAFLTGRLKPGKPVMSEALGVVFLCGGLALYFNVSFLISAMVLGAVIANFAKHHEYPFHAIEGIEEQFMLIFFILAGATLSFDTVASLGIIGVSYIVLRVVGKFIGAYIGAKVGGVNQGAQQWTGPALLPQAGVAIGMGLVAANLLPEYGNLLLAAVITSTIFFEIIGPIMTFKAINKVNKPN